MKNHLILVRRRYVEKAKEDQRMRLFYKILLENLYLALWGKKQDNRDWRSHDLRL